MKNLKELVNRINHISMYQVGILMTEQTSSKCRYEDYQNGDGITKPKITVNKSSNGVELTYVGPETGFCIQHSKGSKGDSIHQLAGVARVIISDYLKELYKNKDYVYPDLKNIIMNKRDKFFKIKVPFVKTSEDKSITNFNERGGWGHDGKSSLNDFKSSISDSNKYGMVTIETKIASGGNSPDITEHWVSFRDLETFPILTSGVENKKDSTSDKTISNNTNVDVKSILNITTPNKPIDINKNFKENFINKEEEHMVEGKKYIFNGFKMTPINDEVKIKFEYIRTDKIEDTFKKFTIVFNPIGDTPLSKNNVLSKNPGSKVVYTDKITLKINGFDYEFDYYVIGLN